MFRILQDRGHPDGPPPSFTDGWGGSDEAMIAVFGIVTEYRGRGRSPTRENPGSGWQYVQMVMQRDEHGRVEGVKMRVVFGKRAEVPALLGESTAHIERSNLTSRLFNGRQVRRTLAFSKDPERNGRLQSGRTVITT